MTAPPDVAAYELPDSAQLSDGRTLDSLDVTCLGCLAVFPHSEHDRGKHPGHPSALPLPLRPWIEPGTTQRILPLGHRAHIVIDVKEEGS